MNDTTISNDDNDDMMTIHMKQKLMSSDEVYVYKLPPLKNSTGHRAEDWNLANPLQTCSLLVERWNDILMITFINKESNQLFARSQIDITNDEHNNKIIPHFIEHVVDSSRYYTIRIMNDKQTAWIGFGFRERDETIDFQEAIQYYEKSINRQKQAESTISTPSTDDDTEEMNITSRLEQKYNIPKLGEGEKIHVNIHNKKETTKKNIEKKSSSGGGSLFLLKKPPPPPSASSSSFSMPIASSTSSSEHSCPLPELSSPPKPSSTRITEESTTETAIASTTTAVESTTTIIESLNNENDTTTTTTTTSTMKSMSLQQSSSIVNNDAEERIKMNMLKLLKK